MPSFKPKNIKKFKSDKKPNYLLDVKHNDFINEFNKNDNDTIPKLQEELLQLKEKISFYKNNELDLNIEQIMEIKDTQNDIKKQITILKNRRKN